MRARITFFCLLFFGFFINAFSEGIDLVEPLNNFEQTEFKVTFKWNKAMAQDAYQLQVSSFSDFSTLDYNISTNQTEYIINFAPSTSKIYWRVLSDKSNGFIQSDSYTLNFINPSQSPNVILWLDANKISSLQPDSTIDTWDNLAIGASDAIQTNPSQRPKLISNVCLLNNKNVVRFDGNDLLNIASGGNVRSAYAVFNFTGGTTFPTYNALLTVNNGISFNNYLYLFNSGTTSFLSNGYFNLNTYVNKVQTPSVAPLNKYKIVSGLREPAAVVNAPIFVVGAEVNSNFWVGDVAEIILTSSPNTTKSEFDSIHTYLYNKYGAPITMKDTVVNANFCDLITLSTPNCFTEYLWSTGATTPTITVPPNKKYSVTVKNIFGQESTTSFNVYPYTRLDNKTIYLCDGDTFKLDLKTPAGFTALWNTGLNNTKIDITQAGQYTVRITDNNSCFVFDTINVVIDKPTLTPSPVSNVLNICLNEKLFLNTATSFDSIHWSTGSTANFITITAPGAYSVYGRTTSGCVIQQNFTIHINGQAPTAKFGNTTLCEDAATIFTDSSTAVAGSTITNWLWTFGDGNSSVANTPINVYANSGTYTVGFKVTTNQGCADSISKTIVVNKRPTASFYNLLSCSGLPTTFVDQSSANAASNINWAWKFDNLGSVVGIKNPTFQFPAAGSYDVQLTVTNSNNCRDSITLPIAVNASPSANFAFDSACGTSPIHFQYLATVVPPATLTSWQWDFGDGTFQSAIKNAEHEYAGPGTYQVKLTVHSSDQCSNTVEKSVKVFDFPTVDFNISPTQCVGKNIQFTDISTTPDGTPMTQWNWYFSGQSTSTQQHPTYAFNQAGNYTIQLTAKNAVGCAGTKLRSIAVSEPPVPQFTFSPQNGLPPLVVNFINQTATSSNFIWDFGDGSSHYNGQNPPPHTYSTLGSYPIKLTATDFRGCSDSVVKYILVDKAVVDAVMTGITLIPSGENHKVQITLVNNSNVEIRNLGLALQTGSGALVVENWEGSLLPGGTLTYNFTGQVKLSDADIPIVCAIIDNVNNYTTESRTDNNTTCKETSVGSFDVLTMFPNPATESINFGVMLPKSGTVQIRFVDILGQILYNKDFSGVKGYNTLSMSTMPLNAAVYVAEIMYDGQTIRKKFMRKDKP